MQPFKLANVLVDVDDFASSVPELYFTHSGKVACLSDSKALEVTGTVDFTTYLNALPWAKWQRYTGIAHAFLSLSIAGDPCAISLTAVQSTPEKNLVARIELTASPDPRNVRIDVPANPNATLIGFSIETSGRITVSDAAWFTEIEPEAVRPIELALVSTTFKKEDYITRNIRSIENEVLGSNDAVADHLHFFVIDNGQTLDAPLLSSEKVNVIPNVNAGGAGGFARGMIETLESPVGFTHVLLMDDDVRFIPESFKRTFNLLSLANDRYAQAFVSGAMLVFERPSLQYEDVAKVETSGMYHSLKPRYDMRELANVLANELTDVEQPDAYGAWWYHCIPLSAVRTHGLPLPLFVRCDDVEFGMRCKPTIMCMSGIGIWHAGFEGRTLASIQQYQLTRNFLIMTAADDLPGEAAFMTRFKRTFRLHLRALAYEHCDLLLDGLEDYLAGPDFLTSAAPDALFKAKAAKNEKLAPLDQLDSQTLASIDLASGYADAAEKRGKLARALELLPYDRHLLPQALLRKQPVEVFNELGAYPAARTFARSSLVALDLTGTKGKLRCMDKPRWHALKKRYAALLSRYRSEKETAAAAWRSAAPLLESADFWKPYLGIDRAETSSRKQES